MAHWNDFDYGAPENRAAAVRRHLARIGLSLNESSVLPGDAPAPLVDPAELIGPPLPGWWYWRDEMCVNLANGVVFSLDFARRFGHVL